MNLLVRAKQSAHRVSSINSTTKRLLDLQPANAFQQCDFYSTKTTRSSQKVQKFVDPVTQKSSGPSLSFSQRVAQQEKELVWPKPREIPFQEKVANFVNFIGYVKIPVRFETSSDGKHFAITVISVENEGGRNSMSIPVVFEGNLAHIVACHVKKNDCVFVSGLLNVNALEFVQSESSGKCHVVAENLNFVEGYEKKVSDKNIAVEISAVELGKLEPEREDEKFEEVQETVKPDFHNKWKTNLEPVNEEPVVKKNVEKSGETVVCKNKDTDETLALWKDLLTNPLQWWDYRNHKSNGLVKEKFPDFKQKVTGNALWISSAPKWVLPVFEKLDFDVKDLMPKQVPRGESPDERQIKGGMNENLKSLLENPDKWWDNRVNKKNPKAPDFKHKETGEVIWVDNLPVSASSKLPPMKDQRWSKKLMQESG